MPKENPVLLFVDGIDGSGKSTLVDALSSKMSDISYQYFENHDYEVGSYHFPSRPPELKEKADPLGRTLFHLNDFYQTMKETRNAIEHYRIFDRSFVSTMAYQGFDPRFNYPVTNRHFEAAFKLGSEALFSNHTPHDIEQKKDVYFIYVRCDPKVAAKRVASRGESLDDVDKSTYAERVAFLSRVQDQFDLCYSHMRLTIGKMYPGYQVVNVYLDSTDKSPEELLEATVEDLKPYLWPRQTSLL